MAKFGSILAQGIIDTGGRNATISLQSRTGHTNMEAVVGLLVFCQYWFWYPLTHFLSLSFTPNCVVGLNSDLKMPKIEFRSNSKPSTFAYPPPLEEKSTKTKEKVETAVLSITAKQKKKDADKQKEEKMEVDEEKKDDSKEKKDVEMKEEKPETKKKEEKKKEGDKKEEKPKEEGKEEEKKEEKKEPEPNFEMMANPARVMKAQLKVLSMGEETRYSPVKDLTIGGVIMMKNSKPGEEEEIVETVAAGGPKLEEEEEPEPPEPFEWPEED